MTYKNLYQKYLKETKVENVYWFQRWYELYSIEWISWEDLLVRENKIKYRWWGRKKINRNRVVNAYNYWVWSLKEICISLWICTGTLLNILKEQGIKTKRQKKFTKEELISLIDQYKGNIKKIAEAVKTNERNVRNQVYTNDLILYRRQAMLLPKTENKSS